MAARSPTAPLIPNSAPIIMAALVGELVAAGAAAVPPDVPAAVELAAALVDAVLGWTSVALRVPHLGQD